MGLRRDEVCSVPNSKILGDYHFEESIRKKRGTPVINYDFQILISHSVNTDKVTQNTENIFKLIKSNSN